MRLYCNATEVLATHNDDQNIEPATYGADAVILASATMPPQDEQTGALLRPDLTPELLVLTRALAHRRAKVFADAATVAITGDVPLDEKLSWPTKEAEAIAYQADNQAPTPILSAEAAITGETLADLAAEVLTNAASYRTISGQIAGLRRVTRTAIDAAETPEQIEAALADARTQAEAMLAAVLG